MTGPEHFREAEEAIKTSIWQRQHWADPSIGNGAQNAALKVSNWEMCRAQVHATLSLAAATALSDPSPAGNGMPTRDWTAWCEVASANKPKSPSCPEINITAGLVLMTERLITGPADDVALPLLEVNDGGGCEALPLPGNAHDGPVGAYIRVCPAGHMRAGLACRDCAGNGAVMCAQCPGQKPAILIAASIWRTLCADERPELVAEGGGPLLDPDCRDGKCGTCIGAPCEHSRHKAGTG